jgi:toxoflavin synthase
MTLTQYTKIAENYAESQDRRPIRWAVTDPSLFKQIGDLRRVEVLDLACGDGRLSRECKRRGAKLVVGVDAEPKMIEIAKAKEAEARQGIRYKVGKVGELAPIGMFELAIPGFLLHYSETKDELTRMCQDIYDHLRPMGKMIGINQNPDCPFNPDREYGSEVIPVRFPVREGDKVRCTLFTPDGKPGASFTNTHWKKSTYEEIMKQVGFKDIKWIPMHVSEEGIETFGEDFWKGWFDFPSLTLLEARK